jgi:hypothetical protein
LPDCSTVVFSLTVDVPSGVETVDFFSVLLSSEQPERLIPRPMARTPAIVRLNTFRMEVPSILGFAAAGDLTRDPAAGRLN